LDKTASFSPSKNIKGNFYTRPEDFKQALRYGNCTLPK
jgi:hypothetical protein